MIQSSFRFIILPPSMHIASLSWRQSAGLWDSCVFWSEGEDHESWRGITLGHRRTQGWGIVMRKARKRTEQVKGERGKTGWKRKKKRERMRKASILSLSIQHPGSRLFKRIFLIWDINLSKTVQLPILYLKFSTMVFLSLVRWLRS